MKMFAKTVRSAFAFVLVAALMLGVCSSPIALAADEFKPLVYVSLGDSTTNGYGLTGYEFTDEEEAAIHAGLRDWLQGIRDLETIWDWDKMENVNGLLMETPKAYPALFRDYLAETTGKDVELIQLALSGMRADDALTLLTWDYEAVLGEGFKATGAYGEWGETIYSYEGNKNVFLVDSYNGNKDVTKYLALNTAETTEDIRDIIGEWEFNPFIENNLQVLDTYGYKIGEMNSMAALYQKSIAAANVVSINLGSNNFSTFLWGAYLKPIMFGIMQGQTYNPVELNYILYEDCNNDGLTSYEELKALVAKSNPELIDLAALMCAEVTDMMKAELSVMAPADGGLVTEEYINSVVEEYIKRVEYAFLGYCYSYEQIIYRINVLNPNAEVIVMNMTNFMEEFKIVDDNGKVIDADNGIGYLLDVANHYVSGMIGDIEVENDIYYADAGISVDVLMQEMPALAANQFADTLTLRRRMITSMEWWVLNAFFGLNTPYPELGMPILFTDTYLEGQNKELVQAMNGIVNQDRLCYLADLAAGKDMTDVEDPFAIADYIGANVMGGAPVGDMVRRYSALYLGLENAVVSASQKPGMNQSTMESMMGLGEGNGMAEMTAVFGEILTQLRNMPVEEIPAFVEEAIAGNEFVYDFFYMIAFFEMGDGVACHPSESGYRTMADAMIDAHENKITPKDNSIKKDDEKLVDFYNLLKNDNTFNTSEKIDLLAKLYGVLKEEKDLTAYPEVAAVEEIYNYLSKQSYINDEQTLAIILVVYSGILYGADGSLDKELTEAELTTVIDFVYSTLIRNNDITDADRIAIIGNVYAILGNYFNISADFTKYAEAVENIYNALTELGYLTDAQAMDIVDFVYVTLMDNNGKVDTKAMKAIAIYVYDVLLNGKSGVVARGGNGSELTPAQKLEAILTVYEELKASDIVNAETYPQLETLDKLADELIFNEDALLTPEQSMAIIDAAFNALVVEEKPAADAVEVLTEVVYNEVFNNPTVDPMVKLDVIDKIGAVVGELTTPDSDSESDDSMAIIAEYTQYIGIAKKVVANLKAEGLFDEHADAQFNALISTVIGILLKGEEVDFATLVETAFSMLFEQPGLTLEDKIRIVAVIYETLDEENLVIGGYDFFGDVDYLVTESEQLLKDLNTAILKNEALVVELKGNLETLNAELEVLVKDLNAKIAELNKLENEVLATLVADRNALVAELLALEEKLVAVQNGTYGRAACADKEALVADTKAAIEETKAAIEELDATIAFVRNQIKTDKSGIEAIKANIAEIKANIAATETALAEVVAALDQLDADLVVLADAVKVLYQVSLGQFVEPEEILEAVITIAKVLPEVVDNVKELYEQGKELAEKVEVAVKDINESIVAINAAVEALNASAQAWVDVNVEKAEEIEATLVDIHELLKAFVNVNYPKVEEAVVDTVNEINALLEDYVKEDVLPLCEEYKMVALAVVGMAYLYAEDKGYIADLENLVEKYTAHAEAKLEELKPELEKAKVELEKAKAELEAKLPVWKEDLKQLKEDLLAEVDAEKAAIIEKAIAEIEAKIEAVEKVIADLEAFVAEVEAQIAAVEAALEAVKAAGETVDSDIIALHEALKDLVKALKDLGCSVNELGENVVAEIEKLVNYGIMIHDDIVAVVDTLSVYCELVERLEDVIVCEVEELINKIVEKQVNDLETLVEAIKHITCDKLDSIIDEIIYNATHGDYVIDNDSFYVALGDSSAVSESYVDALAAVLDVDYANLAQKGLTTAGTLALIEEQAEVLAKADLVTIGFTANIFTSEVVNTINTIMMGDEVAEYDWVELVGEDGAEYVEEALAEIRAKFVEEGLDVDFQGRNLADMLTACVEAYSYKYVEHLLTYPELVDAIHEVAPEALVVIVGMHNTIENIVINVEGNEITLGDYIDYVVGAANIETLIYAILNENTIYVDAPAVETIKESKGDDLTYDMIAFVWEMLLTDGYDFGTSEAGHAYITEQILNALNIIDNRTGLLGDADSDGDVDNVDAMLVLQYDAALIGENDLDLTVCDVNGDGLVDNVDAMLILQYDALLIEVFPVEE